MFRKTAVQKKYMSCAQKHKSEALRWCYTGRFATTILGATNSVATLIQMIATMLQRKTFTLFILILSALYFENSAELVSGVNPMSRNKGLKS